MDKRFAIEISIGLIIVVLIFTAVVFTVVKGIDKAERAKCLTWQEQSTEMTGWYATDWQKVQCAKYDINLY